MAHSWLTRQLADAELSVRSGGDGRTIHGLVIPYDRKTTIYERGYSFGETFARGAFSHQLSDPAAVGRVKFLAQHDRSHFPLGRAVELRDDAAGLVGAFRVAPTTAGDDALALVREGLVNGLSIGFRPLDGGDSWDATRTNVRRTRAQLREVSLVNAPAYPEALVTGVRSGIRSVSEADAQARLRLLENT